MHEPDHSARPCVMIFMRSPGDDARAKRLGRARPVLEFARRRIAAIVHASPDVDFVLVSDRPQAGLPRRVTRIPQRGTGFGGRLRCAFEDVRALGFGSVVAIPGDVPELGAKHIADAFAHLRRHDFVVGPAPDGGVFLLGARRAIGNEFDDVPWQTPAVFESLCRRTDVAILDAALVDIDRRKDLVRLVLSPWLSAELRRLVDSLFRDAGNAGEAVLALPTCLRVATRFRSRAPPARVA